ncbi:CHAP domain-containing protein [Streptococcus henryi]|uniref:CHAP domain-containing protein n=1 Tax=Streptococcus henryi TaxID=439219 RepID=UPI00039E0149|nr:CHAP domain-containing protein [Streptococcus henryi]
MGASSITSTSSASVIEGQTYVEHWSDGEAYSHNLLVHRYGITAGQSRDGGGVTASGVPDGYSLVKTIDTSGYTATSYPWGQCTWFVYNRAKEFGISYDMYMGNGGDWRNKAGYQTTHTPTEHSAISFAPGQANSDPTYGHVVFVEQVKSDGSILVSESNALGLGVISYRVFDAETAKQFTYVIGK